MKKKLAVVLFAIIAFICIVFYIKKDAIFQRGNPVPYLWAASQISEENTYIKVFSDQEIYIAKRGECQNCFPTL